MTLGPAPDWQHISWMVGNYQGTPVIVTIDNLGRLTWGLFSYYDRYKTSISLVSTGVDLTLSTAPVPAGELWVVTNIAARHNDPIPRRVWVGLVGDDLEYWLFRNSFLLRYEFMERQGSWILKEGDHLHALFENLASGKTGWITAVGYKIKVG